jgi:hypothetical protein
MLERFTYYRFTTFNNINFIYEDILNIVNELRYENTSRGYIISTNILSKNSNQVIKEVFNRFGTSEDWQNANSMQKSKLYYWTLNALFLNLYSLCNKSLARLNLFEEDQEKSWYRKLINMKSKFEVLLE